MYTQIAVGEKYPLFDTEMYKGVNGAILEALDNSDGFWFNIFYNRPTKKEIAALDVEKVRIRLLREGNFILPMIMFKKNFLFEMSFDPTLYKDARVFQVKGENIFLNIVLVDSTNGIVKGLRVGNLPLKFIQICTESWARAFLEPGYSEKYAEWYKSLRSQSLERLWMKAEYVGSLGDEYNINEIYYNSES